MRDTSYPKKKKKKIDGPIVVFENVAIGYFLFIYFFVLDL